jgi:DNA polymerase II small subunit
MDKAEIVNSFIRAGFSLAPDALEYFEKNQEKISDFINLAAGKVHGPFITRQTIEDVIGGIAPSVNVARTFQNRKAETTPEEVAAALSRRYDKLSDILSKKPELPNLVSVNRVSEQMKRFSLIVMVREVNPGDRTLTVEDKTGSTSVYISDDIAGEFNYFVEDEVVGLVCDNEDSSENKAVKVVWPDVPLASKAASSSQDMLCIFVSDLHMDDSAFMERSLEKLGDYLNKVKVRSTLFVLGDISSDEAKARKFLEKVPNGTPVMYLKGGDEGACRENCLPDPVIVEVSGVKMLLTHGDMFAKYAERFRTSPDNLMLQLAKKRHLSPTFGLNPRLDEEKALLDSMPDIFVIGHYHQPRTMNYKGTTFISLGSFVKDPVFFAVNTRTRETIKIDLT